MTTERVRLRVLGAPNCTLGELDEKLDGMLVPGLSVTAIGIPAPGLVSMRRDELSLRTGLPRAVVGAWAGFVVGAVVGVTVDVIAGTGVWVPIVGHAVAACAGALAATAPRGIRWSRSVRS